MHVQNTGNDSKENRQLCDNLEMCDMKEKNTWKQQRIIHMLNSERKQLARNKNKTLAFITRYDLALVERVIRN